MKASTLIDITACETVLGYEFIDKSLLVKAFTHSSFANEHRQLKDNERFEFFGDSILGFIVSEYLFLGDKSRDEGDMTRLKQQIVSKNPLSQASVKLGLDKFLLLGEGERLNFAQNGKSICENLFESVVCAIYLDGGIEPTKKFVYNSLLKDFDFSCPTENSKGELQEYVQKYKLGELFYTYEEDNSGIKPMFFAKVFLKDELLAEGSGESKKSASAVCASLALKKLKTKR